MSVRTKKMFKKHTVAMVTSGEQFISEFLFTTRWNTRPG